MATRVPSLDATGTRDTPQTRVEARIRSELVLDTEVRFTAYAPLTGSAVVLCHALATGRIVELRSHDEAEVQRVIRELRP